MTIEQLLSKLSFHPQRKVRISADGNPARIRKIELTPNGTVHIDIKTTSKGE